MFGRTLIIKDSVLLQQTLCKYHRVKSKSSLEVSGCFCSLQTQSFTLMGSVMSSSDDSLGKSEVENRSLSEPKKTDGRQSRRTEELNEKTFRVEMLQQILKICWNKRSCHGKAFSESRLQPSNLSES